MTGDVQARLAAIASEVDRACALLVSPAAGNLEDCARILEGATSGLAAIPAAVAAGSPAQVRQLAESVRHAATLLQHAAEFHQSWRQIRGAMCSGYQPGGSAADADLPARLCLQG